MNEDNRTGGRTIGERIEREETKRKKRKLINKRIRKRKFSIYAMSRMKRNEKNTPPLLRSSKPVFYIRYTVFTLSDLDRVEERLAESFLPNIASSGLEVAGR